jgi:hypothetical protein
MDLSTNISKMKYFFIGMSALLLTVSATLLFYSCSKKAAPKVKGCINKNACNYNYLAEEDDGSCILNPTGTVSTSLSTGTLGDGHMLDFHTGNNTSACGNYSVANGSNGNVVFSPFNFTVCTSALSLTPGTANYGVPSAIGITDVGIVTCLGQVTIKPLTGYVVNVAAVLGHGYVVMLGDSTYARMYCDSWVQNTSGGVIGVMVTWQYPF